MTLILKLDLDMVKTYLYTKNEVKRLKIYSLNRQKHTHTDMTENITYPHTWMATRGGQGAIPPPHKNNVM